METDSLLEHLHFHSFSVPRVSTGEILNRIGQKILKAFNITQIDILPAFFFYLTEHRQSPSTLNLDSEHNFERS